MLRGTTDASGIDFQSNLDYNSSVDFGDFVMIRSRVDAVEIAGLLFGVVLDIAWKISLIALSIHIIRLDNL